MEEAKRRRQSRRLFIAQTVGTQATWSMADYNAKIKISADAREAEKTVKDLNEQIKKLGDVAKKSVGSALNFGSGGLQSTLNDVAGGFTGLRNQLEGGAIRGGLTATALAAGKAAPAFKVVGGAVNNLRDSLTGLVKQTAELGVKAGLPLTGALLGASTALNGASQSLTTTSNLFNSFLSLIGNIPSSVGLAAVAIMAMGPAILSAGSAVTATVPVVGALGRALDNLAGGKVQKAVGALGLKINETKQSFFGLNTEIKTTLEGINALAEGLSLTQLNKQVSDTRSQMEGFHSSTVQAWHAAQQLVQVQRAQVTEQAALNDLVRKAAGLRPQSVENRATNTYNTTQRRKAYESEQLNKFNNEIDEYNRLAVEAAANTKAWEDKLTAITRVAGAGPLGTKSQLSTRVQEFLANKQSAQIARENSAAKLEAERVTSRTFELFPGGQYSTAKQRNDLNEIAAIQNSVTEAVARTGRSQRQLEIASIGTAKSTAQRLQISTVQNKVDAQSIAIARARNLELAKELGIEVNIGKAAANKNKARGGGLGKGAAGALSNAAVGGAFPLLFGQSGAAAAGGAIGGIAGSLIPGIGGFGGSLIGTILGEKLGQGNQVKQLGEDIGFSAEQTKMLGIAFQQAGRDFDKFQQSVSTIQGLSLSIEDQGRAIQLASSLTESYGGKIDKVTNAFAKALSTGKVTQGTLDQLTNNGIKIQQALADKYGVSRTAIIQMAKDGKISVQDLIDTLVDVGNEGQQSASKQVSAFSSAYTQIETAVGRLKTVFEGLFKFISEQISGILEEVSNALSNVVTGVETLVNIVGPKLAALAKAISNATPKVNLPVPVVSTARAGISSLVSMGLPGGAFIQSLAQLGKDTRQKATSGRYTTPDQQQQPENPLETFSALAQLPPSGGSKGTSAADKAARDAARLKEETAKQLLVSQKLLAVSQAELLIAQTTDPLKKNEAEYALSRLRLTQDYATKLKDVKSEEEKRNLKLSEDLQFEILRLDYLQKQTAELLKQAGISQSDFGMKPTGISWTQATQFNFTQLSPMQEEIKKVSDDLTELLNPVNQVATAAKSIGDAFSTSFKGIIDGSMTAREALASFFQSVADYFLDMAAQIISKWIQMTILNSVLSLFPGGFKAPTTTGLGTNFSSAIGGDTGISWASALTKRATGGPVAAGTPYIVGEKGPELFMPGRSGTVIPNDALGGSTNVVVNVDASGNSNVQGDQQQGKQLGVAISAAVQAELVKQQRPGGLLAGTRR